MVLALTPSPVRIAPDDSTPQRAWARDNLRGLLNLFLPSFREDGETLDEDAIRHDVNHAIAQGFSGTLPMIDWTPPGDPRWEQLRRVIIDEARGRLPVHGILFNRKPDRDVRIARQLEKLGVEMILMAPTHKPDVSAEDLHAALRERITATDLPVMLYAALGAGRAFDHLGPAGQPLDVYDRLADLPQLAAVKISQPVTLVSTLQLFDRLADRLSIGPVNLDFLPLLSRHYVIGWSGQWNGEAVQTPSRQLGNEMLAAYAIGDFATGDRLSAEMQPVLDLFFSLQTPFIRAGSHPWQHNRYYSWLGGGNGGVLPPAPHAKHPIPELTETDRADIRAAFVAAGLEPTTDPDECFAPGRTASRVSGRA